jgi:hypothetical protein
MNITRRALARELAYPGLSRLIEDCYGAIATGAAQPVPAADVLGVAQACEALTCRFLLPAAGRRPPDGGAAGAAHDTHRRGVWQE